MKVRDETPFRYAHAEVLTQMVVICDPTRYQLDNGGAMVWNVEKVGLETVEQVKFMKVLTRYRCFFIGGLSQKSHAAASLPTGWGQLDLDTPTSLNQFINMLDLYRGTAVLTSPHWPGHLDQVILGTVKSLCCFKWCKHPEEKTRNQVIIIIIMIIQISECENDYIYITLSAGHNCVV